MKAIAFIGLMVLSIHAINAQSAECIKATKMSWSGGIAGRNGTNYNFEFRFAGYKSIIPDTVWIGDNAYRLFDSATHDHVYNVKKAGAYTYITFSPSESYDENYNSPNNIISKQKIVEQYKVKPTHPYHYPAMLVVRLDGRRVYMPIKHLDELQPQSYP